VTAEAETAGSIGPYRLLRLLGRGGMGEVFLAEDTRLRRQVAIKSLAPKLSESPHFATHLLREARAVARLNHPNIAQVYDVISTGDRMNIVMEHVEGETLSERIRRGSPVPENEAAALGAQIAAALDHAHAHGILHCDLKPGNVFVTNDGTIKVVDFGLARVLDADPDETDHGVGATPTLLELRAGTPAYMSPEQRLGRQVDQRTDIYSLGLILHELCSGKLPSASVLDGDETRTTAEPRVDASIGDPLRAIIEQTVSLAPHQRYESAATLRRVLQDVSSGSSQKRQARWQPVPATRRAWLWAVLGIAIVAAAIALPRLARRNSGAATANRPPVVAIVPFTSADSSAETRYLAAGITELLTDRLSASPALVVVSNSAVRALPQTPKSLDEVSRELGAAFVISGTLEPREPKMRVKLQVFNAHENRIQSVAEFETSLADVMVDSGPLADLVRQRLREAGVPGVSAGPQQAPVTSRAALEDYAHGRELLARFGLGDNLDRALEFFSRSIDRDPKFALAHAAFGEASWRKYRVTRDAAWARRAQDAAFDALRLAPEEARVRYTAALVLDGTGRSAQAADELRRVLQLQPNYADAYRLLGTILANEGKLDAAVREFEAALRLQPASPDTYYALGLAYFDHGKLEDAVRAFSEVTRLRPDGAPGFQALGTSYHGLGRLDDALRNYTRSNEIAPDAFAYSNIGMIRYGQRDYRAAVEAYRHSIELEPNVPESHRNLGDSLNRAGDPTGARRSYERAIELADQELKVNPRDGKLVVLKGVCFAKLGRRREARAAASSAAAIAQTDAEVQYFAAVAYALAGDSAQALRLIRRAVELGFSWPIVDKDDDLATLRATKEFQDLRSSSPTRQP
jgi:serine/threonine-protein kinase